MTDKPMLEPGFELPTISKHVTFEMMRLFSGWSPSNKRKSIHTDEDTAKARGLAAPIAQGLMSYAYLCEIATAFFGKGWLEGGKMEASFLKPVLAGDTLTVKGVVTQKNVVGSTVNLTLDVWCEDQHGEKVTVGSASGVVR